MWLMEHVAALEMADEATPGQFTRPAYSLIDTSAAQSCHMPVHQDAAADVKPQVHKHQYSAQQAREYRCVKWHPQTQLPQYSCMSSDEKALGSLQ